MADWTYTPPKKVPWEKRHEVPLPKNWKRLSAAQLRREPRCQYVDRGVRCIQTAEEVDHIVPRFEGGTDDKSNLQSLCPYHHKIKTTAESTRAWARHKEAVSKKFDFTEEHPLKL